MKKKTTSMNNAPALVAGIGAGVAALAAAGYFLLGPKGAKNRKAVKGWTLKMKGEVLERIERVKEVTPELYEKIVDEVGAKYLKAKGVGMEEVQLLASDLKKYWKAIAKDATPKKAVKKVVKKVIVKK